ncbi:hypothetical protein [Peribacillus asahii]|uniref:hypothetical protein n=1 Tax=Peribacillus asahii TaxID=228899 RepID=UPI0038025F9D
MMRLEEEFVGRRLQYAELLKRVAAQLEEDNFSVRGKKIDFPDEDMEYKISHKSAFGENKLTISIEWIDEQV